MKNKEEYRRKIQKLIEDVQRAERESERDRKRDGYIEVREKAEREGWHEEYNE